MICTICGQPVESHRAAYKEVTGYVRERTQGGANTIRLRKETGRLAHADCVDRASSGAVVDRNQAAMF